MTQTTVDPNPELRSEAGDRAERRKRLRDFQAELVERMQVARTSRDASANQLGVLIGQSRWLVDLSEVGEIISVGAIAKVPLAHDWYLGLTNIRGSLTGVIDFARFNGSPPTPTGPESRIVTFSPRLAFNCGLLVTRVLGLRNTATMELRADGAKEGGEVKPWAVEHYTDSETASWTRLRLSLLVQDSRFLLIGL